MIWSPAWFCRLIARSPRWIWPGIVLSILALVHFARAAQYRVGPGDAIQAAISRLVPGDILILGEGQYSQSLILDNLKGRANRPITIRGQDAVISEPSGRDGVQVMNCAHVSLSGLTVRSAARAGILISNSRNIAVRRCTLTGNRRWGIQTCLSDEVTVEECEVSGSVEQHGIYFSTTDHPVVRNCRIHRNAGCGIHMNGDKNEGGDGMIEGGMIERNRVYENGKKGGAAINMDGVKRTTVQNNLIFNNYAGGITCFVEDGADAGSENRILRNKVVFRNGEGRYALQVLGPVRDIVSEGNSLVCGRGPVLELDDESAGILTANRNVYYAYGRKDIVGIGEKMLTLKRWQKQTGQDRNSVVKDPKWPVPPTDRGWRLPTNLTNRHEWCPSGATSSGTVTDTLTIDIREDS